MRLLLLVVALLLAPRPAVAAQQALSLELAGASIFGFNLSYEGIVKQRVVLRAGLGAMPAAVAMQVPLGAGVMLGQGRHRAQLGVVATPMFSLSGDNVYALSGDLGYRLWPREQGFTLGVSFTPTLMAAPSNTEQPTAFLPWAGLKLGYAF